MLDPDLLGTIARAAEPLEGLQVIEIGPGPGGLTRVLLGSNATHVTAVELDARAIAALGGLVAAAQGRLTLVQANALRVDVAALAPPPRAVVANLPYNIGTALLVNWLQDAGAFAAFTLMFQLEVAQRICAQPGMPAYGRLSVLAQWLCETEIRMHVPANAFTPPPKVDSALVRLVPKANQPSQAKIKKMGLLTAAAFGQRRKMLRGALRGLGGETLLHEAGIDPARRAETLSVPEFERLLLALGREPG